VHASSSSARRGTLTGISSPSGSYRELQLQQVHQWQTRKENMYVIPAGRSPTRLKIACELIGLLVATLPYAVIVVVGLYSWLGNPVGIGLSVSILQAFERYRLTISPTLWTHVAWLAAYAWQGLWLLYAWSFTCRQQKPRTIFPGVYPGFGLLCALNVGWVYSLCNSFPELSLALVALLTITLYLCIGMESCYLYINPDLKYAYRLSIWVTRVLVLNGLVAFAAWTTFVTLLNLGVVLQEKANLHADTSSTVVLSLLASIVCSYILLENTILDRFLRHVFVVYPVMIWCLCGSVVENWDSGNITERNNIFSLVLLATFGLMFAIRIVLLLVYAFVRPVKDYQKEKRDIIPY